MADEQAPIEDDGSTAIGATRLLNLTDQLSEDALDRLGATLKEDVVRDISSRQEWLDRVEKAIELTTQVASEKTWPWAGASNIKYPLVSTAAIQFHARAFPALLGSTTPVRGKVIGRDPDGTKANRADRIGTFMSYQVLHDIEDWMDGMDRALFILPILGAVYKKTYFNPQLNKPVSELIHPRDFIINYDARDFDNCRKTHRLWKDPNTLKEFQNRGIYREFDGDEHQEVPKTASPSRDKTQGLTNTAVADDFALQELYEVHCLLDLDGDGYKEPYIVTLRESDGKVYRIVQAYGEADAEIAPDGKIIAITAKTYFTPYFFLPDPESNTHGLGFGTMVGPINEAVNTIVNQLVDSGTINNLSGGFIARGVRLKAGDMKFNPFEWKTVNSTGDDLRKGIFPLPVREPSNVLFQLLGMLIDSGKDLSSVQDLMVGRNPGQNQPFSTSQMVMEQGLQVFNGIYKRIYRAMSKEFKLLYRSNADHLDMETYMEVLDDHGMEAQQALNERGLPAVMEFLANDFNQQDMDIIPTAEPDMVAEVQKAMKAEALLAKVAAGLPLNLHVVTKRMLEAEQHEDVQELLEMPEPQPDPEIEIKKQQQEIDSYRAEMEEFKIREHANYESIMAEVAIAKLQGEDVSQLHKQFMEEKKANRDEFDSLTKRMKEVINARKDRSSGTETKGAPKSSS